jgi:thiamine-phosphate pyrophosphorylase
VSSRNSEAGSQKKSHKKKPDFRLYLITDRKLFTDEDLMFHAIEQALEGGVKAVQLREKDLGTRQLLKMAYSMRSLTDRYNARLFINDRVDLAMSAGADGVHLGGTSIPIAGARRAAGEEMFIGASTHSVEEAKNAEEEGADFVTLGPVFDTPSKRQYGNPLGLDVIRRAAAELSVPVFALGGIRADHIKDVLGTGAYGVALISAILASDNVKSSSENFVRTMK